MSEIDATAAYEAVMVELQRRLPELHAQVIAEIGRGRELKASEISRNEMSNRNRELASQRLSKLSDSDLAVVDLTSEERLMVVVRAISVATETYNASAATLARFAEEHDVGRFDFMSPGNENSSEDVALDVEEGATPEPDRERVRSLDIGSNEAMSVSREAIEAVLEALDGNNEHD